MSLHVLGFFFYRKQYDGIFNDTVTRICFQKLQRTNRKVREGNIFKISFHILKFLTFPYILSLAVLRFKNKTSILL